MTREEAIAYGKRTIDLGLNDETQAFCELAIKALEQQPCEDTISRADAVRVASGYCHPANIAKELAKLPPATPIRPKGHWTKEFNDLEGETKFACSSCGKYQLFETDFCYNCGSDNRVRDEE